MSALLLLPPRPAAPVDTRPTLWVSPDLRAFLRPTNELGPRRCDLLQFDLDDQRQRVYRLLDAWYLGWLGAQLDRARPRLAPEQLAAAEARWSVVQSWAEQHRISPATPRADYPRPSAADRWQDAIVRWRRLMQLAQP